MITKEKVTNFTMINDDIMASLTLSEKEKIMICYVIRWQLSGNVCTVGNGGLANKLGTSVDSIKRTIKKLNKLPFFRSKETSNFNEFGAWTNKKEMIVDEVKLNEYLINTIPEKKIRKSGKCIILPAEPQVDVQPAEPIINKELAFIQQVQPPVKATDVDIFANNEPILIKRSDAANDYNAAVKQAIATRESAVTLNPSTDNFKTQEQPGNDAADYMVMMAEKYINAKFNIQQNISDELEMEIRFDKTINDSKRNDYLDNLSAWVASNYSHIK